MNITEIIDNIIKCENKIISLESSINDIMAALGEDVVSFETSSQRVIAMPIPNSPYILMNYSGSVYKVLNSPGISVMDLLNYIEENKIYQTAHLGYNNFENKCLGVAKAYGRTLIFGQLNRNVDNFYGGAYTYYDGGTSFGTREEMLKVVYEEFSHGRPCVIQVTTKEGHRHFATVVGIKNHVNSASELREEDLLIIDPWDGLLEAMDNSETADRHLFDDGEGYRVDVFKANYKEETNRRFKAKGIDINDGETHVMAKNDESGIKQNQNISSKNENPPVSQPSQTETTQSDDHVMIASVKNQHDNSGYGNFEYRMVDKR